MFKKVLVRFRDALVTKTIRLRLDQRTITTGAILVTMGVFVISALTPPKLVLAGNVPVNFNTTFLYDSVTNNSGITHSDGDMFGSSVTKTSLYGIPGFNSGAGRTIIGNGIQYTTGPASSEHGASVMRTSINTKFLFIRLG